MKAFGKSLAGVGAVEIADEELGKGGEGSVYLVKSHAIPDIAPASELVAKLYHSPEEGGRAGKVAAMLKSAPDSDSVAWPVAFLVSLDKKFIGYLMTKLDSSSYRSWASFAHSGDRRKTAPDFDVRYALIASQNLMLAVSSMHAAGHCVGDINESNIFVATDARVLLVDSDSAQITFEGKQFPCLVGKPEYTAPELTHGPLKDNPRSAASDTFATAIAVYQMISGGAHPSDGKYTGADDPISVVDRIRGSVYPGLTSQAQAGFAPVPRIPVLAIPKVIRTALLQALSADPQSRLTLDVLIGVYTDVIGNLSQCKKVRSHWYDAREGSCGWCEHNKTGAVDVWGQSPKPPSLPKQSTLPPINFQKQSVTTSVKRAAPTVAGPPRPTQHPGQPPSSSSGPGVNYASHPQAPQTPTPPTMEELKKLHKTSKTILQYADGTQGPRPPLGQLFLSNPKLAFSCLKGEYPKWIRFWWPTAVPAPHLIPLLIGFLIPLAIGFLWFSNLGVFVDQLPPGGYQRYILEYGKWAVLGTTVTMSTVFLLTGIVSSVRELRRSKLTGKAEYTPHYMVILAYVTNSIIYGLPFVVVVLVYLTMLLVSALLDGIRRG